MRRPALFNAVLAAAFAASLAANWYVRRPAVAPNLDVPQRMATDPAYGAFEPNPHFPGGLTLRAPVAGTIPRGSPPLPFGPSVVEGVRAGYELQNFFSMDDRPAIERGRRVYERYCQLCHAADGKGAGPLSKHGFPPPPTLHRPFARQMRDGQMFHLVTFGRGAMPPHAGQIPVDDRWKVVLHVRVLQEREAGAAPPATGGS